MKQGQTPTKRDRHRVNSRACREVSNGPCLLVPTIPEATLLPQTSVLPPSASTRAFNHLRYLLATSSQTPISKLTRQKNQISRIANLHNIRTHKHAAQSGRARVRTYIYLHFLLVISFDSWDTYLSIYLLASHVIICCPFTCSLLWAIKFLCVNYAHV